ncbi:MAG: ABC transporter permease [Bacilli bacterium]|nr:ABC transporter permease [Bacilli bacterium]
MYSIEHKNYLKKIKRHKIFVFSMQILILVLFIFIWQFSASKGLINTFISSSPKRVLESIIGLYNSNNLFNHIWVTIYETIVSFSLGTFIGLIIATILWWNKSLAEILDPYLTILNSLPKVALGPIIIIWVGAKISSIIIMALLISVIVAIINIYEGFINTDVLKINMLKSFGASKIDLFTKLVLPNSLPNIMNVIKVNISMSLIGVIMGEFLVSKEGIGYLITYGSQVFNLDLVMAGIFILCILATIMYYLVNFISKKIIKNK